MGLVFGAIETTFPQMAADGHRWTGSWVGTEKITTETRRRPSRHQASDLRLQAAGLRVGLGCGSEALTSSRGTEGTEVGGLSVHSQLARGRATEDGENGCRPEPGQGILEAANTEGNRCSEL
jgi:hypothetical protein